MRTKRLKVGIRSVEEGLQEFGATLKALQGGKKVRRRAGVYFVSVEAMRRVLTEPRLALLHLIRTRRPRSIASLAKLAKRNFKNVYEDLQILGELGLVQLDQGHNLRDQVVPTVKYERIQFEIAV
ncbi:MAG: hypothetical protein HZA21_01930 [Nitrospirae bacterium]|nr:hypothetical protein [Nitrospirota bacterium]